MKKGKIFAAFGIPGSGKSTTTKEIGKILDIQTFHEPEEEQWGEAVTEREKIGNFTALMWFRSIRVPQIYKADELKQAGKFSMLDSFYDKLFYLYHDKKGIEWLFSKGDKYYEEMLNVSKKDYFLLPDVDVLVFFKQSEENWRKFLEKRNRDLDNDYHFRDSFVLQSTLLEAAKVYCKEKDCKLIIHEQNFSSPIIEAEIITKKLRQFFS